MCDVEYPTYDRRCKYCEEYATTANVYGERTAYCLQDKQDWKRYIRFLNEHKVEV
jgi:hypothetical protein